MRARLATPTTHYLSTHGWPDADVAMVVCVRVCVWCVLGAAPTRGFSFAFCESESLKVFFFFLFTLADHCVFSPLAPAPQT